jgi:hypothetical protein
MAQWVAVSRTNEVFDYQDFSDGDVNSAAAAVGDDDEQNTLVSDSGVMEYEVTCPTFRNDWVCGMLIGPKLKHCLGELWVLTFNSFRSM